MYQDITLENLYLVAIRFGITEKQLIHVMGLYGFSFIGSEPAEGNTISLDGAITKVKDILFSLRKELAEREDALNKADLELKEQGYKYDQYFRKFWSTKKKLQTTATSREVADLAKKILNLYSKMEDAKPARDEAFETYMSAFRRKNEIDAAIACFLDGKHSCYPWYETEYNLPISFTVAKVNIEDGVLKATVDLGDYNYLDFNYVLETIRQS